MQNIQTVYANTFRRGSIAAARPIFVFRKSDTGPVNIYSCPVRLLRYISRRCRRREIVFVPPVAGSAACSIP